MKQTLILAAVMACITQAHAGTNVGFATYGRAKIPAECKSATIDASTVKINNRVLNCNCVSILPRFLRPKTAEAKEAMAAPGHHFVVLLKSVWMGNFTPERQLFSFDAPHSQYALVAKAFQYGDSSGGLDFSPQAHTSGRVIYFSDDVRPGQFLNFGQLIISGPVQYKGNPVAISLFAIEIDSDKKNERGANLISALAAIGRTVAVPASPVLNVLETIGTTLVRLNKDDLNLRYDTISLDAGGLRGELPAAFLAYGDYILLRNEKRDLPFQEIGSLFYNPTESRLYEDEECKRLWPGRTPGDAYAVIQVNKQQTESTAASYQTFSELKTLIENAEETKTNDFKKAGDKIAETLQANSNYRRILSAIESGEAHIGKNNIDPKTKARIKIALNDLEKSFSTDPKANEKLNSEQSLILINRLRSIADDRSNEISSSDFKASTMLAIFEEKWK